MAHADPLPPGPAPGGLLGHYGAFRRDPPRFLLDARRTHGPMVRLRMGLRDATLLADPLAVREVLVEHHRDVVKDWRERDLRWVMGKGLLLSEGDFWRQQRQRIQPAFHRQRVLGYGDDMAALTARAAEGWHDGTEVDVAREMTRLTLANVCRTLFGFDVHEEGSEVARLLPWMMEYMARRADLPLPTWVPIPGDALFQRHVRQLQRIIDRIVAQRRADPGKHDDLLAMLLAAQGDDGKGMSGAQLRDEVMTMFLAGHETTATALTWLWHVLGQRPDVEDQLLGEHRAVLGGRVPGGADVPQLRYTDQVIRETMRLYPPAWMFGREVVKPFEVQGTRFPRGSTLWFSPYVTHREPAWFPEPEAFRPERWTPEFIGKLPEFAYFPFGGGPRVCVGQPFALMELPLMVATLLPRWRIEPLEREVEMLPSVTLRPRRGLRARLRTRAPS